tara:strand:+ start:8128 stop:9618 length:1491 start_codon:yes stop_codon:yes gene_type:complete
MSKHKFSIKNIKKQILSINELIESSFNKLKYFKLNYKKVLLKEENRVFLAIGTVVILTLSYFLIPTFYNKEIIQAQIKNQILKNYDIDIIFNEKINYGLLPKPHFSAKNASIIREKKEIATVKNLKIFVGINQFFSKKDTEIKDLVFKKTDFNIGLNDFLFFKELLKTEPNENKIFIKNSNIFFNNNEGEVLFINKIKNSKFYYDFNNLQNILHSKNELFNVPFKLIIKNDKFNKNALSIFNSKKIRLNIESQNSYDKKIRDGFLEILFINKSTRFNYQIKKNSFTFLSEDKKNSYSGSIDFKPFYLLANFNYEGLSSKNLLQKDSILIDLINSEILNNKNLSANINLKVKDITNINELKNLNLKTSIEEGNIDFSDTTIMWKKDLKITLSESLLNINEDGINLVGTMLLDFKDIKNFYRSFQISKKNRKDIQQVSIDFVYNLNNKNFRLYNPKINNSQNIDLEKFFDNFNSKDDREFNKITFKNFINNFIKIYAG